jgi:4-amino-4-deoxy-L-arabinose transferase-like glycosyltransferase
MLPNPLHPAVVHFPMAFAVLLPISAALAMWAIQRGTKPLRAWAVPVAFALALTASSWVALETGEAQEDRVEAIVGEAPLHEHEEAAERFLVLSGIVLLVAAGGLVGGTVGMAARLVATAGSVVVLAAGIQVGAAGGDLVYKYGAAQAYVEGAAAAVVQPWEMGQGEGEDH